MTIHLSKWKSHHLDLPKQTRNDVTQKGEIIGLHQAKKTIKGIAETPKIWLRTVERIIKT